MSDHSALHAIASGDRIPSVVQENSTPEAFRPLDPNAPASVPDETTIRHSVIRWRDLYDDILRYANGGRQGLVVEHDDLVARVNSISNSLQFLPMDAVVALEPILQQQRTRINTIEQDLIKLDLAVEPTRENIKLELTYLFEKDLLLPQLQALN
ncbi:hypothetical protein [Absidia glauca]|uniref:Uncharacterized protein n=1 Tax=Absidia glauca TaxID=4829 RepID=A0A168LWQ5_ABSGL|nr:hypothetical protein [Absidia glauca]